MQTKNNMKSLTLILMVLTVLSFKTNSTTDSTDQENPFIGSWNLVRGDGNEVPEGMFWVFDDNSLIVGELSGTYSFNSKTSPKQIDINLPGAPANPNSAIYDFPNETTMVLKLMDSETAPRASNFEIEKGYDLLEFSKKP